MDSEVNIEVYKIRLKQEVQFLIERGLLKEAKQIIAEYEEIIEDDIDIDIFSIQSVIAMMEGDYERAENILKDGLVFNPLDFDLLYNMAYLCEMKEDYRMAYKYYEESAKVAENEEIKSQIMKKLKMLEELETMSKYIENRTNNSSNHPPVTIATRAYNVEEYIEECINSVLNQSFGDFEWVILDNGSTDGTSDILKKYADQDSRIKLFRNEKNSLIYNQPDNSEHRQYVRNLKSIYYCTLDSDDYLHKDFIKELYEAGIKNDADIVVAGTEMFKEENQNIRGTRCPPDFFINDISKMGDILQNVYGCFRPIWGKLFKVSVINKLILYRGKRPIQIFNGGDTLFCLDALRFSNSVVGINKVLHYYRIRKNSLYNSGIDKNRYIDYKIIYNESKKLLMKWGKFDADNSKFIANILYYSIKDCMDIAANSSKLSIKEKIEVIDTILSDEIVNEVFNKNGLLGNLFFDIQKSLNTIVKKCS